MDRDAGATLHAAASPLLMLLELSRRARSAGSAAELAFLAVNDTHALHPYRQAALWFAARGIEALSGVVEPEANAPYAQWVARVCGALAQTRVGAAQVTAASLPSGLAQEWDEWLPPYAVWLPLAVVDGGGDSVAGGLLLASEEAWPEEALVVAQEWAAIWHHAWQARRNAHPWSWTSLRQHLAENLTAKSGAPWWRQRRTVLPAAALLVALIPVRQSVLAPGELVPAHPAVIRAPMDGVVKQIQVQPNQAVKPGQALFEYDAASIATRRDVAVQALATAEAEYRQYAQQAVSDEKSKGQLAGVLGKIAEKRAEADFLKDQDTRSHVLAPAGGIVLFDDPSEWVGKPVQTGERIMRIATPGDVEVEAWLALADAIPLPDKAELDLYLAADPLDSIPATVRYIAHDAVQRPDGSYAYRVRATLPAALAQRVGLKGTARISGGRVPLVYWVLRRPLAAVRQMLGM